MSAMPHDAPVVGLPSTALQAGHLWLARAPSGGRVQISAREVRLRALLLWAWGACQGCTLVVVEDLLADPACDSAAACAAGRVCDDGVCVDGVPIGAAPPTGMTISSAEGGVVTHDGVRVEVPPGALSADALLSIERLSATTIATGVDERSSFYRVAPAASLSAAAVVTLSRPPDCDACHLYAALDGADAPWVELTEVDGGGAGELRAALPRLGPAFVAGVAAEVTP
jgi:hypothetical protein